MAETVIAQDVRSCPKCAQQKPATTQFFSFNRTRQKLSSWCKACCAQQRREDRAIRPKHYADIDRRTKAKHASKVKARVAAYWARNHEKVTQKLRARMAEKREVYQRTRREKFANDALLRAAKNLAHKLDRQNNPERYKEYAKRAWSKASQQTKFNRSVGSAISHSLRGRGKGGKTWSAVVGYSVAELRNHLERQFLKGMSWANYGEWHIDHIVPLASFTYDGPDDPEFRRAWALTNLRPLWAAENVRKGGRRTLLL
jgi:hypothetical protein